MVRFPLALAALLAAALPAAAQDLEAGKRLFNQCRTCHMLEPGKNAAGPSLAGVYGRTSGTLPGYGFSPAMREKAVVWTDETLAAYVRDPRGYIPRNKMVFAGLKKDADIANLLAYLKDATK